MNSRTLAAFPCAFLCGLCLAYAANDGSFKKPDSLLLKDGSLVEGLIVKNTATSVVIQGQMGEETFSKQDIVRIRDEANFGVMFTDIARRGDLPPWRVLANDLRTMDQVQSLVEIPATPVEVGPLRHVPYLSFAINDDMEINIYGDPEDPAGIEIGIYGAKSSNQKLRKSLRSYLAGYLTMRSEIRALYGVSLDGGTQSAGDMRFEVTPLGAPDSYGAWWISCYNIKDMQAAKLDAREYARLTKPAANFRNADGQFSMKGWTKKDIQQSARLEGKGQSAMVIKRGFYRDKQGQFRMIGL